METNNSSRNFKEVTMFFKAKVNKTPYEVTVKETRKEWHIALKKDSSNKWKEIILLKENYQIKNDSVSLIYNNSSYIIDVRAQGTDYNIYVRGSHRNVSILDDERILRDSLVGGRSLGGQENLKAGMPGKIVKIFVKPGDKVKAGDPLIIMEAMKMENEIKASEDSIIDRIHIAEGVNIESGSLLISFGSK